MLSAGREAQVFPPGVLMSKAWEDGAFNLIVELSFALAAMAYIEPADYSNTVKI